MGVQNFIGQLDDKTVANLPELHQTIIKLRPPWAFAAFGLAIFSGVIGSVFLLLRKNIAFHFYIMSFIGVIIQAIPYLNLYKQFNFLMILFFTLVQIGFSMFLIWYTKRELMC